MGRRKGKPSVCQPVTVFPSSEKQWPQVELYYQSTGCHSRSAAHRVPGSVDSWHMKRSDSLLICTDISSLKMFLKFPQNCTHLRHENLLSNLGLRLVHEALPHSFCRGVSVAT